MPKVQDESDSTDIPGDQRDGGRVMIEDDDRAIANSGNDPKPKKQIADPVRRGMCILYHASSILQLVRFGLESKIQEVSEQEYKWDQQ